MPYLRTSPRPLLALALAELRASNRSAAIHAAIRAAVTIPNAPRDRLLGAPVSTFWDLDPARAVELAWGAVERWYGPAELPDVDRPDQLALFA